MLMCQLLAWGCDMHLLGTKKSTPRWQRHYMLSTSTHGIYAHRGHNECAMEIAHVHDVFMQP